MKSPSGAAAHGPARRTMRVRRTPLCRAAMRSRWALASPPCSATTTTDRSPSKPRNPRSSAWLTRPLAMMGCEFRMRRAAHPFSRPYRRTPSMAVGRIQSQLGFLRDDWRAWWYSRKRRAESGQRDLWYRRWGGRANQVTSQNAVVGGGLGNTGDRAVTPRVRKRWAAVPTTSPAAKGLKFNVLVINP